MNNTLTIVALRYRALYLDIHREDINLNSEATAPVMALVARLKENGFCLSEELLHALNAVSADTLAEITKCINNVMGVNLNWAPLVKKWNVPTGENRADHLLTLFTNLLGGKEAGFKGTTLRCGHFIPEGTFPLERYNGCPFCGTPFRTANFVYKGQGSKLKELRLFTNKDMQNVFASLLASPTPLDATQKDSLEKLLTEFPLPEDVQVAMKETAMLVVKTLISHDKTKEAAALLKTPTDILRYLWYEKTGLVQIVEPKTLVAHARRMYYHVFGPLDMGADAAVDMKQKLKLKYNRKACSRVALWMNSLPMTARQAAENMNPKRGMWVRMIRALRMGEYSRKKGMEHLAEIIDVFYNQSYSTWQGRVDKARTENDADKLPARLLLSLGNAAESYFDFNATRLARPITGGAVSIEPNKLLALYNETERQKMASDVMDVYKESMVRRFAAKKTEAKTIYIDPTLYKIPVGVGDRATTIQDTSCALMGTRFQVEGDAVRLFLQWGKGLHAQPLDMDLSCRITFDNYTTDECAFYNLSCVGAKHSCDIRSIPEMVGTAEYIELSMPDLLAAKAKYVMFTCNAYSCGTLSPNLVVGWMDSAYPMQLSEETGVAYDPSCVQHMVRISESNLSKGLVFGVLDVEKREIVWLEMPFTSQTIRGADSMSAEALLSKLEAKLTIGELLDWKAMAQNLEPVVTAQEADEAYTYEWALNPADVARLLNQEG